MTEEIDKGRDSDDLQKGQEIPVRIKTPVSDEPLRVTDRRFWVNPPDKVSAEEPPASLKPTFVEDLEKRLADSEKKLQEVLAAHRDFKTIMATERRQARERIQSEYNKRLIQAKGEVAEKFIQILENLERALATSERSQNQTSLLDGIQLIRNQFRNALSELGLKEIFPKGEAFSPDLAEAVQMVEVESEAEDNMVMDVVSRGYSMNDQLIRPARVVVGRCRVPLPQPPVQESIQ